MMGWRVDVVIEVHCEIGVVTSGCNKFGSFNVNVTPRMEKRPWSTFNEVRGMAYEYEWKAYPRRGSLPNDVPRRQRDGASTGRLHSGEP